MTALSFINGNDFWAVKPIGDYEADCDWGREYANELIAALRADLRDTPVLSFIAQTQVQRGRWTGIETAFWQTIQGQLSCCKF